MQWASIFTLVLVAPAIALIRFQCSQLVVERLDPLVHPRVSPSPHLHQIVGGDAFNAFMDPKIRYSDQTTCTTCQFAEDFSNYWTAVMYFKARNGTYERVPQKPNVGFEGSVGGTTVYYMQDSLVDSGRSPKVTAFQPGFRMFVGNPDARTRQEALKFRQLTYTCLETMGTRYPETKDLPKKACPSGIMVNVRFPTCWDGKNLDSEDHMSHMSYPLNGTFESQSPCPASHPVRVPQLMYETIWDTAQFNDKSLWPEDGSQPFVWSTGDNLGFGNHGDYIFGWKDDSLQKIMDSNCYVRCPVAKMQSISQMNKCRQQSVVNERIDGWLTELPGGVMT
jgi:hypothetical protein